MAYQQRRQWRQRQPSAASGHGVISAKISAASRQWRVAADAGHQRQQAAKAKNRNWQ
jgi:hypothetical protein